MICAFETETAAPISMLLENAWSAVIVPGVFHARNWFGYTCTVAVTLLFISYKEPSATAFVESTLMPIVCAAVRCGYGNRVVRIDRRPPGQVPEAGRVPVYEGGRADVQLGKDRAADGHARRSRLVVLHVHVDLDVRRVPVPDVLDDRLDLDGVVQEARGRVELDVDGEVRPEERHA